MIPKTLSATSIGAYEGCPARWSVEFLDKAPSMGGEAASLGSACHRVLELLIEGKYHTDPAPSSVPMPDVIKELWEIAAKEFSVAEDRWQEGLDLCLNWWNRQLWDGKIVLSTELKETFPLKTSIGEIPFTYIWDRCDLLRGTPEAPLEVEVIDYKTYARPLQPDALRRRIQSRAYAVAAQMKWPTLEKVWVTFDLLRYDPVGVVFTVEENRETYRYLRRIAEEIIANDEPEERLNPECRWCIRATGCESLRKHAAAGGPLAISDPNEAADLRADLDYARAALAAKIGELDDFLLEELERREELEITTERTKLRVTARKTREVDPRTVARIVGSEIAAEYGNLPMKAIDNMLKEDTRLTDEQKSQVRQVIRTKLGNPSIKTEPLTTWDET